MRRLRQLLDAARAECRLLTMWLLAFIPGRAGRKLRNTFLPCFVGNVGKDNVFQSNIWITSPKSVTIGSNCNFARGVYITGGGGVTIGNWVGLGPDVKIWSVNHRFTDPDTPWMLQGWDAKAVVIEDDVWIGAAAFIMPGVTIGKGAIVSACAVVGKSVPPYAIIAGNPGRVIGWRKKPDEVGTPANRGGDKDRPVAEGLPIG
jgi:acetyltransferase-like isoleucine patch superfamily enzyme